MHHAFSYNPDQDPNRDEKGKLRPSLAPVGRCLTCGQAGTEAGLDRIACIGNAAAAATEGS